MLTNVNFRTEHFEFVNYVNMTEEQSYAIWEGRNHPDIRRWMENPEPFPYESHKNFVQSLKDRNDRLYWAIVYNNEVIGSYGLNPYDINTKEGEMGKYLLSNYMGQGLGKLATEEFLDYVFTNKIVSRIVIKTLISNTRNQHVNKLMGFEESGRDDKYVYMELNVYPKK